VEFWLHGFAVPGRVAEFARRAEAWGFAGLLLADSQNLTADIWVELCLAAAATTRLRIGPGVTNPVTRHLAVTASAAATLQRESGGRVSLGIGKGDSALSQIGLDALTVREFEEALGTLQGFLRGEEVVLRGGVSSRIRWLAEDAAAKVPVHVAASGPRTIAAAARHAEGVDLTVGGEVDRVARGVAIARGAAPAPIQVRAGARGRVHRPVRHRGNPRCCPGTAHRDPRLPDRPCDRRPRLAGLRSGHGYALVRSLRPRDHRQRRVGNTAVRRLTCSLRSRTARL
jgi:5,10-methylenetetrahydromethanopterin reductase